MTVYLPLECPSCQETKTVVKFGRTTNNKQRYRCLLLLVLPNLTTESVSLQRGHSSGR
ncbi:MAG: hypothetical protein KC505_10825 [Myxococcales bacterium]|nr:hypothetical protein [Myxococcales bacterium]USN51540.1 MAG: hypothetical protein H6731_03795 [Myxococcales bacterium]